MKVTGILLEFKKFEITDLFKNSSLEQGVRFNSVCRNQSFYIVRTVHKMKVEYDSIVCLSLSFVSETALERRLINLALRRLLSSNVMTGYMV